MPPKSAKIKAKAKAKAKVEAEVEAEETDLFKEHRERLRRSITDRPLYCQGILPLPDSDFTLYYGKEGDAHRVNLSTATPAQLQHLAETCQPATFGVDQKDVYDETYRKAGKLDNVDFAMKFDASRVGLIEAIRSELIIDRLSKENFIRAELYKLNVYGPNSFFKAHVDTPRSKDQFGSLVIVFPTQYEGGALMIRQRREDQTKEWSFDSAALLAECTEPSIAYVAFYSDVEHEVMPVLSGYRVTITYNLYWDANATPTVDRPLVPQQVSEYEQTLKKTFQELLDDPTFFPKGGNLLFGLAHKYPLETPISSRTAARQALQDVKQRLKGTDALIRSVCRQFSLDAKIRVVYDAKDPYSTTPTYMMCDHVLPLEKYGMIEDPLWSLSSGARLLAHPRDSESEWEKGDLSVEWVTGSPEVPKFSPAFNHYKTAFIAYGNEASLDVVYWHLWLFVRVGPVGKRSTRAPTATKVKDTAA